MEFVYDLTVDPDAENNTHAFALAMVGHNKRVLEVGCATGYFTKVLAERGCKVVGMEIDRDAAAVAEEWAERVVVGNVGDPHVWESVDDESFDVITFGDVLEHLRDPLAVLQIAVRKLKASGFVVTSLPNVAHGDVRLALLHGSFQYRETGLLDRTHVRFFTLQSIRQMLREAGLVVVDTQRVVMPLFQSELGLQREDYPDLVVEELQADTEFETYQFVMKSVVDNGSAAVTAMAARMEELADRAQELEVRNRLLHQEVVEHVERATKEYAALNEEHGRLGEQIDAWAAHVAELNQRMQLLQEELRATSERAEEYAENVHELSTALAASEERYDALTHSMSFRLTAPLRRLRAALRQP